MSDCGGKDDLVIAVAQPVCVPHDVAANAAAHAEAVRSAGATVVVFPELSLTGYELDAAPLAAGDPRLSVLVEACAEAGALALAGAPVDGADGRPHIAMLAVDGSGGRVAYRKMHLGAAEAKRFAQGPEPAVHQVGDWRLGLAICKDTGDPEHADATARLGIDAYVAGMVECAEDAFELEQRAERIAGRHRVWVALASFAGPAGSGYAQTAGRSGIWAPDGTPVARAGREPGAIARTALR
jgi:predicted amidohydrolase